MMMSYCLTQIFAMNLETFTTFILNILVLEAETSYYMYKLIFFEENKNGHIFLIFFSNKISKFSTFFKSKIYLKTKKPKKYDQKFPKNIQKISKKSTHFWAILLLLLLLSVAEGLSEIIR